MNSTDDEVLRYLSGKEPVRVARISEDKMKILGTTKQNCHHNVYRYVSQNKHRGAMHVYGWTVLNGFYLLHSVVKYQDGKLECITPSDEEGGPRQFINFIEDPQIGLRDFEQNGKTLTEVVRNGRYVSDKIRIPPKQNDLGLNHLSVKGG